MCRRAWWMAVCVCQREIGRRAEMLDHDSAVAPRETPESYYDGPLRAYERYRTRTPSRHRACRQPCCPRAGWSCATRPRFEATCRAVQAHSAHWCTSPTAPTFIVDGPSRPPDYLAILLPSTRAPPSHQGREFDVQAGETAGVICSRDTMHAEFGAQASVLTLCVDVHATELALGTCSWNRAHRPPHPGGPGHRPARRSLTGQPNAGGQL